MYICKTCGLKTNQWFWHCPNCGVEGTFKPIGATTLESLEKEKEALKKDCDYMATRNFKLQALNRELVEALKEIKEIKGCTRDYDTWRIADEALEKAEKVIEDDE